MKDLILSAYCKTQVALTDFAKREDGATAIEYALIAGLIAVVIITATGALGKEIAATFDKIVDAISTATP